MNDENDRITLSEVTRITVTAADDIAFERFGPYRYGVVLHVEDEGRTLRVSPRQKDDPR